MYRREVLSLYRRIFRIARQWQATAPADTETEKQYIREEARKLFHRNKDVSFTYNPLYKDSKLKRKRQSIAVILPSLCLE